MRRDADKIRRRCRSLAGFIREAWHILEPSTPLVWNWHLDVICAHLEAISRGTFLKMGLPNRIVFNVPPGSMKSLAISVMWQAWEWGPLRRPGLRYLSTAYADTWVIRDVVKTRDLVASDWYQTLWGDVVGPLRYASEHRFDNLHTGERRGMPFGSLTAGRGHRLLIDDPHSVDQSESEAERARAIGRFRDSATSRLNDPKRDAIVIVMQRLHMNDLSGVIQSLDLPYIMVVLPMHFDPARAFRSPLGKRWSDPRTRAGELFFPARWDADVIARDGKAMTAYAKAGQWEQTPNAKGGARFQRSWFEFVRASPVKAKRCRGWDLAATEKKKKKDALAIGPAYTAGVRISRDAAGVFYIEDVVRAQLGPKKVKDLIKQTAELDAALYGDAAVAQDFPQDPGSSGKMVAGDIVTMLPQYPAFSSVETGDKEARAEPMAAQAEAGNVKIVAYDADGKLKPWVEPFLNEIELFPAGRYKDQVDASSRAYGRLANAPQAKVTGPVVVTAGARYIPGQESQRTRDYAGVFGIRNGNGNGNGSNGGGFF